MIVRSLKEKTPRLSDCFLLSIYDRVHIITTATARRRHYQIKLRMRRKKKQNKIEAMFTRQRESACTTWISCRRNICDGKETLASRVCRPLSTPLNLTNTTQRSYLRLRLINNKTKRKKSVFFFFKSQIKCI